MIFVKTNNLNILINYLSESSCLISETKYNYDNKSARI